MGDLSHGPSLAIGDSAVIRRAYRMIVHPLMVEPMPRAILPAQNFARGPALLAGHHIDRSLFRALHGENVGRRARGAQEFAPQTVDTAPGRMKVDDIELLLILQNSFCHAMREDERLKPARSVCIRQHIVKKPAIYAVPPLFQFARVIEHDAAAPASCCRRTPIAIKIFT